MHIALTGAASGIGAEVAARMKRDGHQITAFDIYEPRANIDRWIPLDLNDADSITAALAAADGPFDALINNAGIPPREGNAELVLSINFIGLRAFLRGMIDQLRDGAAIVTTASRAGSMWRENIEQVKALMALRDTAQLPGYIAKHGIDHVRAYNLSKEAVIAMTISGTEALIAKGLRMNTVSPSAVNTDILDDFFNAFGDRAIKNNARVGRPGQPDEIADVIAFLAGSDSRWLKGADITTDGGISAAITSDLLGLEDPFAV